MNAKRLSSHAAERIASKEELHHAAGLFSTFHQKPVTKNWLVSLSSWPKHGRFGVVDVATRTGYVSNKWDDQGRWTEYTHKHLSPLPHLLMPYQKGQEEYPLRLFPPTALAWLGYALDVEVKRKDGLFHWSFQRPKKRESFPSLCAIAHPLQEGHHVLVILPAQKSDPLLLLASDHLLVTERGIEN